MMKKIIALITVAILSLGLLFGLTSCAGNKNYFYSDGIGLDKGEVSYLCSYYKYHYMSNLASQGYQVEDTEKFWSTPYYGLSSTLGDYLKYYGEKYIINLIASNILFDEYEELTYDDKVEIELAVNEIIQYYNNGSKSEFKNAAKKYGFNYKDLYSATEMMYKAFILEKRVFADNMDKFAYYYDEFFSEYKRVRFIFVETEGFTEEQITELDSYKNRLSDCLDDLSDGGADRAALEALINEIKAKYGNSEEHYLHGGTEATIEFGTKYEQIAAGALELSVGDAKYVDCKADEDKEETDSDNSEEKFVGTCFMYCIEPEAEAYKNTENKYFKDFYSLAVTSLANLKVSEYTSRVSIGKKWESFDAVAIPFNSDYVPVFYS